MLQWGEIELNFNVNINCFYIIISNIISSFYYEFIWEQNKRLKKYIFKYVCVFFILYYR